MIPQTYQYWKIYLDAAQYKKTPSIRPCQLKSLPTMTEYTGQTISDRSVRAGQSIPWGIDTGVIILSTRDCHRVVGQLSVPSINSLPGDARSGEQYSTKTSNSKTLDTKQFTPSMCISTIAALTCNYNHLSLVSLFAGSRCLPKTWLHT